MAVHLEDLVEQYGTNLLRAPLTDKTVLEFEFYGRIAQIKVTDAGNSAEFSVVG